MQNNDALVKPAKPKNLPNIGSIAVMIATAADLYYFCNLNNFSKNDFHRLSISRLYYNRLQPDSFSVIGPFVGAPYAVMLVEALIACGARKVIFLGWCGAVAVNVKIGDIILPTSAVIDEGTSAHYRAKNNDLSYASSSMTSAIRQVLYDNHIDFHTGPVWTTDAIYRETRQQVETHQKNGILAVDMEISALYTVAKFRRVDIAGILVVSDELSSFKWRPGFKHERFIESRQSACKVLKELVCCKKS